MLRPTTPFTVAAVEFNPEIFEFERNVERACAVIEEAARGGARLIVMPEAALSGYIYRDLEQFRPYMDTVPGRGTTAIEAVTRTQRCYVAIGIAEIDEATGLTYNTGALIGPDGYIGKYRKNGLNPSDIAWFTPGNTGYPVFETELGRICMIICYDDTYWEPARLPAIKGADIIAYICASDRVVSQLTGPDAVGTHSTIAAVEQLCAWNGLAMVAADRNNTETNPTTGVTVTYGGAASIWQADGTRTAHAPATDVNNTPTNPGRILYGELDPKLFDNDQKATLARRRPELYGDLAFFRAPTDPTASTQAHTITATALQLELVPGDSDGNVRRTLDLVVSLESDHTPGLVVLPAFSVTGSPVDAAQAHSMAESALGRTVQLLSEIAGRLRSHVVGSHIERDEEKLFHTCVLIGPDGRVIGSYRQTHLDPEMSWATPGTDLPVFDTAIGRIAMLAGEDVRFPEASGVLGVRRADLIAIPSAWRGDYGGWLHDAGGLFAHRYPENTMTLWYAIAKTTQAYTVVANPVGGSHQGSSGIFSINPVDSDVPPIVGSLDRPEAVRTTITTLGDPRWFMDQHRLIGGRRPDLAVPLMLSVGSTAFVGWRDAPGYDITAWSAYRQGA
jgi:predicted amidohydrolase